MNVHVRLRIGAEAYAMPAEHVLEVAELGEVVVVPGAAAAILGVRNLRGEVLPVVDLGAVLGLPRDGKPQRLLVAEAGGRKAGFAIDEVTDVGRLTEPVEETESELLLGAALADDELVGFVDVPRLFETLARDSSA
jgi:purine-binding chemotaxis protein CheW